MGCHPILDLDVWVRVLSDGAAWEMGLDHLNTDTFLAGGESAGTVMRLTPDLIEVSWQQGTSDGMMPTTLMPRPEAGTASLTLWDPHGSYLPPANSLTGGIRPGRPLVISDRADGTVLWSGWVEQLTHTLNPEGAGLTTVTAVDSVTRLSNGGTMPAHARSPESPAERAAWVLGAFFPTLPHYVDPGATGSMVAGTQVGDSVWRTLADAADVELGQLIVLRDGTVVMLANGAGEFVLDWTATYSHEERTDAGRPFAGEIRVDELPDRFTITVHPPPSSGGWDTPPAAGETLRLTMPSDPSRHITGPVLGDAVLIDPHWTFDVGKDQYVWPGVPGRGTLLQLARLGFTSNPPGTVVWVQPECAPLRLSQARLDLTMLRNAVMIRRRDVDPDLVAATEVRDDTSIGHYGRWEWAWMDSPHDTAAGELRAAAMAVQGYAYPRPTYAVLTANLAAGALQPYAAQLLQLIRTVNISNTIEVRVPPDGRLAPARVAGWQWVWTAAGALDGEVFLAPPLGDPTMSSWFLGVTDASELDRTAVLA